ncbi:MAG: hypothetical protein ACT4OE_08050 [Sphingosinicella sp.]
MTVSVDGTDLVQALEVAVFAGVMLAMVLIAFIVWLMVRPARNARMQGEPRHVREARRQPQPHDKFDGERMLASIERIEQRLATFERGIAAVDNRLMFRDAAAAEPNRRKK